MIQEIERLRGLRKNMIEKAVIYFPKELNLLIKMEALLNKSKNNSLLKEKGFPFSFINIKLASVKLF